MGSNPIVWYACGLVSGLVLAWMVHATRMIVYQHYTLWKVHAVAIKAEELAKAKDTAEKAKAQNPPAKP